MLDTLKAVPAVFGGVLLIVMLPEVGEKAFKDGIKFVVATGNVVIPRCDLFRTRRAHIDIYWRNVLLASDT